MGAHDYGGPGAIGFRTYPGNTFMIIEPNGKIGMGPEFTGTNDPKANLHVKGSNESIVRTTALDSFGAVAGFQLEQADMGWTIGTGANDYGGPGAFGIRSFPGVTALVIEPNGNVGIGIGIGSSSPQSQLHVAGTTTTEVLKITGGADLSESFHINSDKNVKLKPGMLASIDPNNPGDLTVSTHAYDCRVAGVISGAKGIQTGMMMGQEGTVASGDYPVALTGRVYCWADASYGSIRPGDFLTTSETPGHAMRALDYTKARGAIVGKAMSKLNSGKGFVLVLIQPQ